MSFGDSGYRSFRPGEDFEYVAFIYNAKGIKPDLEVYWLLIGNGKEVYRSDPEPVDITGLVDFSRIPLRKRLDLKNTPQSGRYVLQLFVRDKHAAKKKDVAAQSLEFEILQQ